MPSMNAVQNHSLLKGFGRLPFKGGCTWLLFPIRTLPAAFAKGAKMLTKRQGSLFLKCPKISFLKEIVDFRQKAVREKFLSLLFLSSRECECACVTHSLPFEQGSNSFVNRKLFCFEGASRNKTFSFHWLRNFMQREVGREGWFWLVVSRDLAPSPNLHN